MKILMCHGEGFGLYPSGSGQLWAIFEKDGLARVVSFDSSVQAGKATWKATLMSVVRQKCFEWTTWSVRAFHTVSLEMGLWKNTLWAVIWGAVLWISWWSDEGSPPVFMLPRAVWTPRMMNLMNSLLNETLREGFIPNTQCPSTFSDSHGSQYDSRNCGLRTKHLKLRAYRTEYS